MNDRDDDQPLGEPEPAGPSEVVSPGPTGASASAPSAPGGGAPVAHRVGSRVRLGLVVLGVLGALAIVISVPGITSPERSVCAEALREIEAYQDDLPADSTEATFDVDAISCGDAADREEAVEHALSLEDVSLASEATYRTSSIIGLATGVLLAAGSLATVRTRSRTARVVALVGAGFAIVIFGLVLFPIVLAALLFGVYAIFFSADARAVFGEPSGPGFLRPRPR